MNFVNHVISLWEWRPYKDVYLPEQTLGVHADFFY